MDPKLAAYMDAVISAAIRPSAQHDVRRALALIPKGGWAALAQPLQLLALRRYLPNRPARPPAHPIMASCAQLISWFTKGAR